jgi:hypothetical protein
MFANDVVRRIFVAVLVMMMFTFLPGAALQDV